MSKVLIVEDHEFMIKILGYNLSQEGFDVLVATNGTRALEIARQEKPSLVLLDIMIPDPDGYEVCRQLKADPATASIPIIFVSALGQASDIEIGKELGASDFFCKPFSPSKLIARIKELVR